MKKILLWINFIMILFIAVFVIFYFVILTPGQRDIIFRNIASQIPVIKNFVLKQYDTGIIINSVENMNFISSANYNVDYLITAKRGNDEYIAIYPFNVEAGVDVKKINVENTATSINIFLPAPEIFNVDMADVKNISVIRDEIKNYDYETYIKPLLGAFEMKALDNSLESGILENAGQNTVNYLKGLFSEISSEVNIKTKDNTDYEFYDYLSDKYPFGIKVLNKNMADEEKIKAGEFLNIRKDGENIIFKHLDEVNYSYSELLNYAEKNLEGEITYKLFNPKNYSFGISFKINLEKSSMNGVALNGKNLFSVSETISNKELLKNRGAYYVYVLLSLSENKNYDKEKYNSYISYINTVKETEEKIKYGNLDYVNYAYEKLKNINGEEYSAFLNILKIVYETVVKNNNITQGSIPDNLYKMLSFYYMINNNSENTINEYAAFLEKNTEFTDDVKAYIVAYFSGFLENGIRQSYIKDTVKSGKLYLDLWTSSGISDSDRKIILKNMYLNNFYNSNLSNLYLEVNGNYYSPENDYEDYYNYFMDSDIIFDSVSYNKYTKKQVTDGIMSDWKDYADVYFLMKQVESINSLDYRKIELENYNSDNFKDMYGRISGETKNPFTEKDTEKLIKENLTVVLSRKFTTDIVIFMKNGIISGNKGILSNEFSYKYWAGYLYTNDDKYFSHDNTAVRFLLNNLRNIFENSLDSRKIILQNLKKKIIEYVTDYNL